MENDKLKKLWEEIQTQRDELKVQMHLAKAELKDEWEELEKKFPEVESRFHKWSEEFEDSAEELKDGLDIIGSEIKDTYRRIRTRLRDELNDD